MGVSTAVRKAPRAVAAPEHVPCANAAGNAVADAAVQAATGGNGGTAQQRGGGETIEQCILRTLEQYFRDLDGARPHQLHEMVMRAIERPLLRFALERSAGNQSAASDLLGINRNTLRKKMIEHGLADGPPPKPAAAATRRAGKRPARRTR